VDNIIVDEKTHLFPWGTISCPPKATNLQGVHDYSQKNIIENKIDKLVYNAENDITVPGEALQTDV